MHLIRIETYIPAYWSRTSSYPDKFEYKEAKAGEVILLNPDNILRISPGFLEPTGQLDGTSYIRHEKTRFSSIILREMQGFDFRDGNGSGGGHESFYVKGSLEDVASMCGFIIQQGPTSSSN